MAWSRWRARWKRPDGAPVSMTLTSTLLRRRTSRRNPRIPTISAGRFHGEAADVSAVDTGLLVGSTPRGRCDTGSGPSRPTPRGWGSTGQRLCVLHEPPAYVEYPRPSFSSSQPSCSTRQAPPKQRRNPAQAPGRSVQSCEASCVEQAAHRPKNSAVCSIWLKPC